MIIFTKYMIPLFLTEIDIIHSSVETNRTKFYKHRILNETLIDLQKIIMIMSDSYSHLRQVGFFFYSTY